MKSKLFGGSLLALAVAAPVAMAASALDGAQYLKDAKVDLQAAPGTIVAQELEREKGGSGLRYSFDVKAGNVTREVGIDAQTGGGAGELGRRSVGRTTTLFPMHRW